MKKMLSVLLIIGCLLLAMAGCSAAGAERTLDRAVTPPQETGAAPTAENQITQEQAQQIALDYVGLTADQVQRLRTRFEIDDGMPQYDVEFFEGSWEYEFEIDAVTGDILSYDRDDRRD